MKKKIIRKNEKEKNDNKIGKRKGKGVRRAGKLEILNRKSIEKFEAFPGFLKNRGPWTLFAKNFQFSQKCHFGKISPGSERVQSPLGRFAGPFCTQSLVLVHKNVVFPAHGFCVPVWFLFDRSIRRIHKICREAPKSVIWRLFQTGPRF